MKSDAQICIVTVGYNRPDSMQRLLNSLSTANYDGDKVDLCISIDKGKNQASVVDVAENYIWKYGNKNVRAFTERQGLRRHIIQCGDLTEKYEAVIILEDDITVSECFYQYVKQSIKFYYDSDKIAGISLYKHEINVGVNHMFEPEYNGYDAFLMQYAQSWGQCWTRKMWKNFKEWYIENAENIFKNPSNSLLKRMPNNVLNWDSHSWLKYYIAYVVEKDLYYVYPYHSLSTNHSEAGQHNILGSSSDYEIALATGQNHFSFPKFEKAVKYDVFFERMEYLIDEYKDQNIILDLYGNKKYFVEGDILISSQCLPYKVIDRWAMKYRPQEVNCKNPQAGNAFYVYDLHIQAESPKNYSKIMRTRYDVRAISWKELLNLSLTEFKISFLMKFKWFR